MSLTIQPWALEQLTWFQWSHPEGHPQCLCSLCGLVIGVADDDPRKYDHDPDTCDSVSGNCEICEVAVRLFKGEGNDCREQRYHWKCFERVARVAPELGPEEMNL
jgi:hypothetical protein